MVSIMVHEPGALEVESANVPEPKANEVVVKVRRDLEQVSVRLSEAARQVIEFGFGIVIQIVVHPISARLDGLCP
jgi:hypothetical protein